MKRIVTFVLAALLLVSLLGGCVRTEEDYKAAIYRHVSQKHHGTNMQITAISVGKNTRYVQIDPDGSAQATVKFDVQNAIGMTLHMSSVVRLNRDLEVTSCDYCDTFGIASSTGPGWSMGSGASEETEPETEEETESPATEPEESSQTFAVNQELLEVSGMTYGELRAKYGEPQIRYQREKDDPGIWIGYTVVFPDAPGLGFEFDQMTLACSIPLEDGSVSEGIFAPIGEVFLNYGDGRTIGELRELLPSARMTISPPAGGECDFRYSSGKLLYINDSQEGYIVEIALGANESEEAIQQIDDSYYLDSQTPVELVNTGRWA